MALAPIVGVKRRDSDRETKKRPATRRSSATRPVTRRGHDGGEVLAPDDWPVGEAVHAPDGRKVKAAEHVGAIAPDADPTEDDPDDGA